MKATSLKLVSLAALLCVMILVGKYYSDKEANFPYSQSSAEIQIIKKEDSSTAMQRTVYAIKAKDIEGEAILTSVDAASDAQSMIHSQLVGVKSTFASSRAPYGGHITAFIECNAHKYLKEEIVHFKNKDTKLILAVASDRHIFGGCALDQIKNAAVFWAAFDEKRMQVLTIKLFKAVSDPSQVFESQQEILRIFRTVIDPQTGM